MSKMVPLDDLVLGIDKIDPSLEFGDGTFTYVDIGSVSQSTKVIETPQTLPCSEAPSRARQVLLKDDVLVSTVRPNLNAVARITEEFDGTIGSTGFSVLRPNPEKLEPSYLYHWVRTSAFIDKMMSQATGQSYPAVSDKVVKGSKIPLPPLEEQKRIAGMLDQADALRRLRTRALDKLNTLGQAIFHEMFGNVRDESVKKLKDVAELINGDRSSNYPSGDDLKDEGVLFLSTKNIRDWRLALDKVLHITEEKFASLSRGKLQRGDLVITLRGTLGQAAIFDCEFETGFINAQMMIIRPKKGISSQYLLDFLSLDSTQHELNKGQSGSAVKQLTAKQVGELPVVVPSASQQSEYGSRIAAHQKSLMASKAHLQACETLFASLQHRAFRGEL